LRRHNVFEVSLDVRLRLITDRNDVSRTSETEGHDELVGRGLGRQVEPVRRLASPTPLPTSSPRTVDLVMRINRSVEDASDDKSPAAISTTRLRPRMRGEIEHIRLPIDRNQPMKVTFGLIGSDAVLIAVGVVGI
jgi:hypothetical protein